MLTTLQILDAAENVLRRHGPRKTTVVDVARALDVSHGTVYRHFSSKAALHEAITARWLERITSPLLKISNGQMNSTLRLRAWFETLMDIKINMLTDDPEMFESYSELAKKTPKHIKFEHIKILLSQVEKILIEGNNDGSFDIENCETTAYNLFTATNRYHHPLHANEWHDAHLKEEFHSLFLLLERAIEKRD